MNVYVASLSETATSVDVRTPRKAPRVISKLIQAEERSDLVLNPMRQKSVGTDWEIPEKESTLSPWVSVMIWI